MGPVRRLGRRQGGAAALYLTADRAVRGLHLLPDPGDPAHGRHDPGLPGQDAPGDVQRHAGPAHPLFRQPPARRYHELLHQRYRHHAPAGLQLPALAGPLGGHRAGRVLHHALVQPLDDPGAAAGRGGHVLRHQDRGRRLRQVLHAPAEGRGRHGGLRPGDDERPEGGQGLLPRGAEHRGLRQGQQRALRRQLQGQRLCQHPGPHHLQHRQHPLCGPGPGGRRVHPDGRSPA